MLIERHIFGSRDGYRTLARSPCLTDSDCKALEGFAFGTPYDPTLRASLAKRPAYWSRPINRSWRALTLVTLGNTDDAGRPTLLFISAVVSTKDWNDVLHANAASILESKELWKWNNQSELHSVDVTGSSREIRSSERSIQNAVRLISKLEHCVIMGKNLRLSDSTCTLEELVLMESLLPRAVRSSFSLIYRAMKPDMVASVVSFADSKTNNTIGAAELSTGSYSPYANRLVAEGILQKRIPHSTIDSYLHFAKPVIETSTEGGIAMSSPKPARLRSSMPLALTFLVLGLLVGALSSWFFMNKPWPIVTAECLGALSVAQPERAAHLDQIDSLLHGNNLSDDDVNKQLAKAQASVAQETRTNQEFSQISNELARVRDVPTLKSVSQKLNAAQIGDKSSLNERVTQLEGLFGQLSNAEDQVKKLESEIASLKKEKQGLSETIQKQNSQTDTPLPLANLTGFMKWNKAPLNAGQISSLASLLEEASTHIKGQSIGNEKRALEFSSLGDVMEYLATVFKKYQPEIAPQPTSQVPKLQNLATAVSDVKARLDEFRRQRGKLAEERKQAEELSRSIDRLQQILIEMERP